METTKHPKAFDWLFWLLVGIVLVCLASCTSKKKSLEVSKVETVRKNDIKETVQNNITTIAEFTRVANRLIVEPKDSVNRIIIGKDTIQGAKRVIYEKEEENSQIAIHDSSKVEKTDKSEERVTVKQKSKHKEKKGMEWYWWVIIALVGLVVYFRFSGKKIKLFP